jgi:hypothetical protein
MRLAVLIFLAWPLSAELLSVEVDFQSNGCLPCTESLEARLQRVRGVESVELDIAAGAIRMKLAAGNRVRVMPLSSRITQDRTKISAMRVVVRGTIADGALTSDGVGESYRLDPGGKTPAAGRVEISGKITIADEPGLAPTLAVESLKKL